MNPVKVSVFFFFKKDPLLGTCPGGPVVETLCFRCREHGFNLQWNYYPICCSAKKKHPLYDSAAEVKGKEVMLHWQNSVIKIKPKKKKKPSLNHALFILKISK